MCNEGPWTHVNDDELGVQSVAGRRQRFPHLCSYELNVKRAKFRAPRVDPPAKPLGHNDLIRLGQSPDSQESVSPVQDHHVVHRESWPTLDSPIPVLSVYRLASFPMLQSDRHRFYLDHFIANTANLYFPLQPDAALSLVMPTAENSPCMLGAMVAASCSHYFRLKGNQDSRTIAIAATVQSLSSLRETITTPTTGTQSAAILPTTLMLATTCVCAGDTATFRQHLDGALHIIQRDGIRHTLDPLWWLSRKWLVHLLLMNRLSGLPLPSQQRKASEWSQLLMSMPDFGQIDVATGLSRDLVAALDEVCELKRFLGGEDARARSLETRLIVFANKTAPRAASHELRTELECSHSLFTNATLLSLYRRVDELPKTHPKVQAAVESTILLLQKIDTRSRVNMQLLWPLVTAGCEATNDDDRNFIVERMEALTERGLGGCGNVIQFMKDYWETRGDTRWDVFAQQRQMDMVLF
ncbi:hypothetical protein NM208_g5256 [Fusarium decemcellulare]|uniref:Uncharacterized protein n=1 Tax=Fusarium decemcellulare TaxID=57161 RepID=A0ACC1SHL9_9HYPO|nr:hypothetical protein NM208_g5256 [Fusarium decemcellulare]